MQKFRIILSAVCVTAYCEAFAAGLLSPLGARKCIEFVSHGQAQSEVSVKEETEYLISQWALNGHAVFEEKMCWFHGTMLNGGVQSRVLVSPTSPYVIKIPRQRDEIERITPIFWNMEWGDPQVYITRITEGFNKGRELEKTVLSNSRGILPSLKIGHAKILVGMPNGHSKFVRFSEMYIQRRADMVLEDAISQLYAQGKKQELNQLFEDIITTVEDELWKYGVFDLAPSFSINWGVIIVNGKMQPKLLDTGELTDEISEKIQKRLDADYWRNEWSIFGGHPKSIESLTDKQTAERFFEKIQNCYNSMNFEAKWGSGISPISPGRCAVKPNHRCTSL